MGCDIHMYVEYKPKEKTSNWKSFGGRINPGRNYWIFGILAGVRSNPPFSFEPKGFPEDAGYEALNDNRCFISETTDYDYVTMDQANRWVEYGSSTFINGSDGNPVWVTNPDWHTHSWLSVEDFEKAILFFNETEKEYTEDEYEALLAAMKKLSEFDNDVRILFWFDN